MKVADSIGEKWLKRVRIFWKERGIRSFVLLNKWKLLCLRLGVACEVFYCSGLRGFRLWALARLSILEIRMT